MKEEILRLRKEGKNYNQIKKILGCSKGTISYHCGEGQKEKTLNRQRINRRKLEGKIRKKYYQFLYTKVHDFKDVENKTCNSYSYVTFYRKVTSSPICYLSGRRIDLEDTRSYHLDHIISKSKGGSNSLRNCGLACKEANQAKSDLSVEEFIQLCKDILEYNGFIVNKINN